MKRALIRIWAFIRGFFVARVEVWPRTLHLWCEAGTAEKYDRSGLHANCIVHAISGISRVARTIRCIHPWYRPYQVRPSDATLTAWMRTAKAEGCIAVSLDWEGWAKDAGEAERFVRIAAEVGLVFMLVPKWTLDPSGVLYFGATSQSAVISRINGLKVPALLPWLYMGDSAWRRQTLKSIYRDNGYFGQLIGMTDGGMREGDTDRFGNKYNTVAETLEFMSAQARDGQSVGLFNVPVDHQSLKYALALYRP